MLRLRQLPRFVLVAVAVFDTLRFGVGFIVTLTLVHEISFVALVKHNVRDFFLRRIIINPNLSFRNPFVALGVPTLNEVRVNMVTNMLAIDGEGLEPVWQV